MRAGLRAGAAALVAAALAAPSAADRSRLTLTIDAPLNDSIVGDPGGMAFVSGKALALFGELQTFDILFVIDVSESTAAPSGADVDQDGKIGARRGAEWLSIFGSLMPNSDRGDSVLAAEIAAVEVFLQQLDPRSTRVGMVAFSGDHDPMTPDAWTVVPLTSDFEHARKGLDELLDIGPNGMTNMVSGVDQAIRELMGFTNAYSERRDGARRVMIFLTDGSPTLPLDGNRTVNARMAIERAKKAGRLGIRVDTYAIGEEALNEPVVAVEMARVTNGVFTPVRHPKNLRAIFEEIDFAEIDTLDIVNKSTGKRAEYSVQNADGSFAGLIEMREGRNVLEVFARATDGSQARQRVSVRFLTNGRPQELSPRNLAQRNRLLENRLLDLKRRSLEIETERDEEIRRQLMVEIEKERTEAEARAAEARKALRLDVED